MSTTPKLTLIGLYNYTEGDIFENIVVPTDLDKSDFIDRLLFTRGELSVLYPDPVFLKSQITAWSEHWLPNFTRIYQTLSAEYNPLHNFDRYEEIEDAEGIGKVSEMHSTGRTDTETESKISAYNDTSYQPDSKSTAGSGNVSNGDSAERTDRNLLHDAHLYGNVGLTTSQQMVAEETKLRLHNRIYDIMGDVFAQELLILVY